MAVRPVELSVTTALTSAPAASRNSKVLPLTVAGSTASLKVTVMLAVRETPVAPLAGEVDETVGAVVSTEKLHTRSAAKALPARSFTRGSVAPPRTLAV